MQAGKRNKHFKKGGDDLLKYAYPLNITFEIIQICWLRNRNIYIYTGRQREKLKEKKNGKFEFEYRFVAVHLMYYF